MKTVRFDVKESLVRAPDPAVREAVNTGMVDDVLNKAECSVWKKFDTLRAEGAFKKGIAFGFKVDGSSIVEGFLKKIFGDRPVGCV